MVCLEQSEGPEGAGKTTILQLLGEALQKEGYAVLLTRNQGASYF